MKIKVTIVPENRQTAAWLTKNGVSSLIGRLIEIANVDSGLGGTDWPAPTVEVDV